MSEQTTLQQAIERERPMLEAKRVADAIWHHVFSDYLGPSAARELLPRLGQFLLNEQVAIVSKDELAELRKIRDAVAATQIGKLPESFAEQRLKSYES